MQVVLVHLRRGRLLGHPGHQALAHLGVLYHPLFRSSLWAECNTLVLEIIILRHLLCVEPREPLLDVSLKFALLGVSSSLATASSWLLNFPSWLVQVVGGGQVQLVVQEHISQVGCCRSASTRRPCTGDRSCSCQPRRAKGFFMSSNLPIDSDCHILRMNVPVFTADLVYERKHVLSNDDDHRGKISGLFLRASDYANHHRTSALP